MDKLTFLHYTSLLREINRKVFTALNRQVAVFLSSYLVLYLRRLSLIKSSAFINILVYRILSETN